MSAKPSYPPFYRGSYAQVYAVPGNIVRKFPEESKFPRDPTVAIRNERAMYREIGDHPRIARWIPSPSDDYIDVECYLYGNLFDHMTMYRDQTSIQMVVEWGRQIIEAVGALHAKGIVHSDLNLRHVLLDNDLNIRLAGFNAASHFGEFSLGYEKTTHFAPRDSRDPPSVQTDLFALGSTLYELAHGKAPYGSTYPKRPASSDPEAYMNYLRRHAEAEERIYLSFRDKVFPDLADSFCELTIHGCWDKRFTSAEDILPVYNDDTTRYMIDLKRKEDCMKLLAELIPERFVNPL